jgi:hypothetical protein
VASEHERWAGEEDLDAMFLGVGEDANFVGPFFEHSRLDRDDLIDQVMFSIAHDGNGLAWPLRARSSLFMLGSLSRGWFAAEGLGKLSVGPKRGVFHEKQDLAA